MNSYVANIGDLTKSNHDFRQVLYTGKHLKLVHMALKRGEDIGAETHTTHDQFFRIEKGRGHIAINGNITPVKSGDAIIAPAVAMHNFKNTGNKAIHLCTLYGPPNHTDKLTQQRKAEAVQSRGVFDGVTTEQSVVRLPAARQIASG